MIVYLVTADHAYTLNRYLQEWAPSLVSKIQPVFYEEEPWDWLDVEATYIFSDIERLTPAEMLKASAYAKQLIAKGFRVLNHPDHAPMRLALQNILHQAGINPFRMFPVKEAGDLNFPVFLRLANSHQGSIGDLIHSRSELDQRLSGLSRQIALADDLVVAEYCDTRNSEGRYTKFSAMQVGEKLVPRHAICSTQWMLKVPDIVDAAAVAEEKQFLLEFPQREAIRRIFALAKIDFGRIDFGMQDGEVRVWEINTNPTFMPRKKGLHSSRSEVIELTNHWLMEAFASIDANNVDISVRESIARRHEWKRKLWWLKRKFVWAKRP